jgi:hypothetical protein
MTPVKENRVVSWDKILDKYGPEARAGIQGILNEYDIPPGDPVEALISAMFLAQVDTLSEFEKFGKVMDKGQASLSDQFKAQVEQLRGIVSYANEHLVDVVKEQKTALQQFSEEKTQKRQEEIIGAVRKGMTMAIAKSQTKAQSNVIALVVSSMLLSAAIGTAATLFGVQFSKADTDNAYQEIVEANLSIIETCVSNQEKLKGKCVIEIP